MREITLKELAAYLPYGLKYYLPLDSERFDSITEGEPWRLGMSLQEVIEADLYNAKKYETMWLTHLVKPQITYEDGELFLGQMLTSLGFEEDDVFINEVKPILRPLSALTEPIEHEGETINPIDYLNENKSVKLIKVINSKNQMEVYNTRTQTTNIRFWEHCIIEKLLEWKFDIFGLIQDNLAIPVTKEFNPYK
jgi:hypothetical protein